MRWVMNSHRNWENVEASMPGTEMKIDILILLSLGGTGWLLVGCLVQVEMPHMLNIHSVF